MDRHARETVEVGAAPRNPSDATRRPELAPGTPTDSSSRPSREPTQANAISLPGGSGQTFPLPPTGVVEPDHYPNPPRVQVAQAIQILDDGHRIQYSYSPDTVASELLTADLASTRWFDLLASDAAQADKGFSLAPTRHPSPAAEADNVYHGPPADLPASIAQVATISCQAAEEEPSSLDVHQDAVYPWQLDEDICLRSHEADLFRNFAERAALWLDLFDPHRHFSTHATRLAVGLLVTCLPISAVQSHRCTRNPQDYLLTD